MSLRAIERRHEPRTDADLGLLVWCIVTKCPHFLQEARALDISLSGARLSGLDVELSSGDVVGIIYAGKRARYQVIWVRKSGVNEKVEAAVQRIADDECPWKELLNEEPAGIRDTTINAPASQA